MAVRNEHRFGISGLSKENINEAFLEEILVDKMTGEMLIKTPNGDIVSFDYNNRLRNNLSTIKKVGNDLNIYGNIYNIEFESLILPCMVSEMVNYLDPSCELSLTGNLQKFKRLLLNVDISSFIYNENSITKDEVYPEFTIGLSLIFNDNTSKNIEITDTVNIINNTIINLSDYLTADELLKDIKNVSFNNFILTGNYRNIYGTSIQTTNIRTILYSLYALIETY